MTQPTHPRRLPNILFQALGLALLSQLTLSACDPVGPRPERGDKVELIGQQQAIDAQRQLGISIDVFQFQPLADERSERLGQSTALREAQQRYLASHLKHSLANSDQWGKIRVQPQGETHTPLGLNIQGKILEADAETLQLHIVAKDALGSKWLDKDYQAIARPADYRHTRINEQDPFQSLYNAIANDLLQQRQGLDQTRIDQIRRSAKQQTQKPFRNAGASDAEIAAIEQRLQALANTYDQTYDAYYRAIWSDYLEWRKQRLESYENIRESARKSTGTTAFGIGAIAAGILAYAYGDQHNSTSGSVATAASIPIILGGAYATSKGIKANGDNAVYLDQLDAQTKTLTSKTDPLLYSLIERIRQLKQRAQSAFGDWKNRMGDTSGRR